MDALLPILVGLTIAALASNAVLVLTVVRSLFRDQRSKARREAREARRYAPIERPLLP